MSELKCSGCDRNLTSKSGQSIIGVSVQFHGALDSDAMKELYPEIDPEKTFNICYVCWLKSMGVQLTTEGGRAAA